MRFSEAEKYQGDAGGWKIAEEKIIRRGRAGRKTAVDASKNYGEEMESSIAGCSIYEGDLILVNQQYPYRDHDTADFVSVQRGVSVLLKRRAAVSLFQLIGKIDGWDEITAVSGWRSMAEQQEIWDQSIIDSGMEFTKQYVAVPGHSEHQTGLAIDLGKTAENIDFIRPDFPYSGICQKFRRHMASFGFIERYPEGKEKITGIAHEPWHFRYVGAPHAEIMMERGLTLEEYHDFVKQYPWGKRSFVWETGKDSCRGKTGEERSDFGSDNCEKKQDIEDSANTRKVFEISWLSAEEISDIFFCKMRDRTGENPQSSCKISGDNMGGFIVTIAR